VKRKIELFMVLFLLMGAIVVSWKLSQMAENVSGIPKQAEKKKVVVIDPGHGGEDPGKVGVNDTLEKDINLQIALKLKPLLEEKGIEIVMTRESDEVPKDNKEDLQGRVKLINDTKPSIVVCIHQNSFTDASVKGAQVFYYAGSDISENAAQILQEEFRSVDTDNTRQIKANDNYFLLKRTEVPAVIVECGFLSNYEEAQKLVTEEYQKEIATAICNGIIKWLDN